MRTYTEAALSSVKEAGLITVIDLVPAVAAVLLLRVGILDSVGLILLLEGAGLMLVGGALGFTGPGARGVVTLLGLLVRAPKNDGNLPGPIEKGRATLGDVRAAFYMITGLVLFSESLILAFLFLA